ncbi:hypothetical protein [Rhizomicrobium electricum]|uniref:Uncharacterized protein n=1 Tax=Rhizomicrobium electricum TaxID=480070 RepID=A0ABN1FB45_9PROT|nr:hypothetical protein [Rhizomicrobium electricum]NIJ50715.1 hypothetical protein [Rhizomicrobium electricum]
MAKRKATPTAAENSRAANVTLREEVMETLLQLHIGFCGLGRIQEAGPLLHSLMELAYHAPPPGGRKRRSGLN